VTCCFKAFSGEPVGENAAFKQLAEKVTILEEKIKKLEEKCSAMDASSGLKVQNMQGRNVSETPTTAAQNPYGTTEKLDPKQLEELNKNLELIKKSKKEQEEFLKQLDSGE
jgi:polyhydroxyalkanoate synthesis regulator phasin